MTIIASYRKNGTVWMAADGLTTSGDDVFRPIEPKIARKKVKTKDGEIDMLVGTSGAARMVQLVRVNWKPPAMTNPKNYPVTVAEHLAKWVESQPAVKTLLDMERPDEAYVGYFLCALQGRVFYVTGDWCAIEEDRAYASIGSGSHYANGVLFALERALPSMEPSKRLSLALGAAHEHLAGISELAHLEVIDFENQEG